MEERKEPILRNIRGLLRCSDYMFGITALTGYVTSVSTAFPVLLFFELVIATIGTIATSTWIGLGMLIQKFYLKHYRITNIVLALMLLECIWSMVMMQVLLIPPVAKPMNKHNAYPPNPGCKSDGRKIKSSNKKIGKDGTLRY